MGALRDARPRAGGRSVAVPAVPRVGAAPFRIDEREGAPGDLVVGHAVDPSDASGRLALLVRPTRRALVLGSAQGGSDADVDACTAAGVDVARRRSGGGAVLVGPGDQVWLDVFLPAADPLYEIDVSRAAWWLGEVWVAALADAGVPGAAVHRGPMRTGAFGRQACFAGLGPGEVTLEGRKLVGISQRRDRRGAWLHTMALACPASGSRVAAVADLLRLEAAERAALARHLEATTTRLEIAAAIVEAALVAQLT